MFDIQKKTITKTDSKNLNAIEESGSELKEVGKNADGYGYARTTQCIVVKKLTKLSLIHISEPTRPY